MNLTGHTKYVTSISIVPTCFVTGTQSGPIRGAVPTLFLPGNYSIGS